MATAFDAFNHGVAPGAALAARPAGAPAGVTMEAIQKSMRLLLLVRAYQARPPLPTRRLRCACARRAALRRCARAKRSSCWKRAQALTGSGATQVNGHSLANLDPLGLDNRPAPIELDPALYGFTEADLDKECAARKSGGVAKP